MLASVIPSAVIGHASPRVAPPLPLRSDIAELQEIAATIGYPLIPWQEIAGTYCTAKDADDRNLYREVAIIVARRNGKTTLLIPLIIRALRAGMRVMHVAQNRELPREIHREVVNLMIAHYHQDLPARGGYRFGAGQEEIRSTAGGVYRIVAAGRGGARGLSNDLVIIDELREIVDNELIAAAKPTIAASPRGQIVYVSNAGTDQSVILNALRARAGEDERLAYLEWSASPERNPDDVEGWVEANPSLGHIEPLLENITAEYKTHRLAGTLSIFETEYLCRWVISMRERLVDEYSWSLCEVDTLGVPKRPYMGISMDPNGGRASAAIAWRLPGEAIAVQMLFDVTGSPINTDLLGNDLAKAAAKYGVQSVGGDPLTDSELGKFFRKWEPISGRAFANASSRFVLAVQSRKVAWHDADALTDDLTWTTRKEHDESGSFQAVRADDDRPITASLAAIRAVWLASNPVSTGEARIW